MSCKMWPGIVRIRVRWIVAVSLLLAVEVSLPSVVKVSQGSYFEATTATILLCVRRSKVVLLTGAHLHLEYSVPADGRLE